LLPSPICVVGVVAVASATIFPKWSGGSGWSMVGDLGVHDLDRHRVGSDGWWLGGGACRDDFDNLEDGERMAATSLVCR
jgi:hypothetical protein